MISIDVNPDITIRLEVAGCCCPDEISWNDLTDKPTDDDALALLAEMDIIEPLAAADGAVYTDNDGVVYVL